MRTWSAWPHGDLQLVSDQPPPPFRCLLKHWIRYACRAAALLRGEVSCLPPAALKQGVWWETSNGFWLITIMCSHRDWTAKTAFCVSKPWDYWFTFICFQRDGTLAAERIIGDLLVPLLCAVTEWALVMLMIFCSASRCIPENTDTSPHCDLWAFPIILPCKHKPNQNKITAC